MIFFLIIFSKKAKKIRKINTTLRILKNEFIQIIIERNDISVRFWL
jgi:hypothetical protein